MAAANTLWLKLVLILLWTCGYFPVQNPVKAKLKIEKLSLPFIISIALVVVIKLFEVNFLLGIIITKGGGEVVKLSTASLIFQGFSHFGLILNDLAARLVGFFYGCKICLLIQNLYTFDCYKRTWGSVNDKPLGKVNTDIKVKCLWPLSSISNYCLDYDSNPQLKWKDLKYYVFWALASLINGWVVTLYIIWSLAVPESETTEGFFDQLSSKWFVHAGLIILNLITCFSIVVPLGFLIIMGSVLIDNYRGFYQILENQYNSDVGIVCKKLVNVVSRSKISIVELAKNRMELTHFEDDFVNSFTKLRESFYLYNDVAGVYAISNLFLLAINLSYAIYNLIWPQQGQQDQPMVLFWSTLLLMTLLLTFSNYIKNEMSKCKEKLSRIMIKEKLRHSSATREKLLYTSEWVISWNWEFSGCNICPINYELIPGIVCSLMAFMTFLVQLEMSEKSSNGSAPAQSAKSTDGNL